MKVILSIKPQYAEKILNGSKKFEFRKAGFSMPGVTTVVIYATKPVGKVVGEFEIDCIHIGAPSSIWKKTKIYAGIDRKFFDEYYRDKSVAVAIGVGEVKRYRHALEISSLGEGITAPQSFRYLHGSDQRQLSLPICE